MWTTPPQNVPPPRPPGRAPFNVALALLAVAGIYGAVWISDDFDRWRFVILTYAGIPVTASYFMLEWLYPKWAKRFRPCRLAAIAIMTFAFATGVLPLVNALTAGPQVVKRSFGNERYSTSHRDFHRGGLGQLYQRRW